MAPYIFFIKNQICYRVFTLGSKSAAQKRPPEKRFHVTTPVGPWQSGQAPAAGVGQSGEFLRTSSDGKGCLPSLAAEKDE